MASAFSAFALMAAIGHRVLLAAMKASDDGSPFPFLRIGKQR